MLGLIIRSFWIQVKSISSLDYFGVQVILNLCISSLGHLSLSFLGFHINQVQVQVRFDTVGFEPLTFLIKSDQVRLRSKWISPSLCQILSSILRMCMRSVQYFCIFNPLFLSIVIIFLKVRILSTKVKRFDHRKQSLERKGVM